MPTLIHKKVAQARDGTNPHVIARLRSGWAVMGEVQFVKGYVLLLPDPVVPNLNALQGQVRQQYLSDLVNLGDVILQVTAALRINYEILGNLEPALHAHLFPRYADEPENLRTKPVWFYNWQEAPLFTEGEHGYLRQQIYKQLSYSGLLLESL